MNDYEIRQAILIKAEVKQLTNYLNKNKENTYLSFNDLIILLNYLPIKNINWRQRNLNIYKSKVACGVCDSFTAHPYEYHSLSICSKCINEAEQQLKKENIQC